MTKSAKGKEGYGIGNTDTYCITMVTSGFSGLVVNMLASGTQDHGFEPS
jgi:hypothetical protein